MHRHPQRPPSAHPHLHFLPHFLQPLQVHPHPAAHLHFERVQRHPHCGPQPHPLHFDFFVRGGMSFFIRVRQNKREMDDDDRYPFDGADPLWLSTLKFNCSKATVDAARADPDFAATAGARFASRVRTDLDAAVARLCADAARVDPPSTFLQGVDTSKMDANNRKVAEQMKSGDMQGAVRTMFRHPDTGRALSYSEMRSFYG